MKRPEHIIEDLITRQLDGTPLTDTERRELQEWLEASEANRDAFLRAYKAWGNARLAETRFNTGQALENVMARIAEASRPRSFLRPQLRRLGIGIAAAACVMLAVVGYYRLQPSTVPDIEMFIRQADTPVFTQKEVQLVLSEQKTLLLETQKSTIRYDSTAIRINNAEKTIPKKEAATFNQLVVPYGKQTTLTLADGTRVWVNAGSWLIYPSAFDDDRREIYAEGEIYIEVAHDAARPFTVHTGKMDVRVLGTRFYVSSYGRDRTQEVVLRSGSVSVAPAGAPERGIRIVPDQRASLDTAGMFRIREVRAEDYISWIHGYYRFDNTPLSDVLARLARYYNRTFDCSPEVGVMTISGKLELNDDPGEVLRILSLTAPIRFRVSENGFRLSSVQTLRKEHDDNPNRMPMENHEPN